jgi:KaiC/GvpD/RAD55 family RecA-like ATPase
MVKHQKHVHKENKEKKEEAPKKEEKKDQIARVPTGIPGLDHLMSGGFIPNDAYLVTGTTGTGKTIFCCQFINEGLKNGEKCIYFTLEETPEDIMRDAAVFGWDFEGYIKKKQLVIEKQDPFEMVDITSAVRDKVKHFKANRVVIDSTSLFGMVFKDDNEMRKRLYELIKAFKDTDAAVVLTAEIPSGSEALSRFGVEEFIVDGVITLNYLGIGAVDNRSLEIRKMRRTHHATGSYIIDITKEGIKIKKEKEI